MLHLSPSAVAEEVNFADLEAEYAELAKAAQASECGWAYTANTLTPGKTALLGADIKQIVEAVEPLPKDWQSPCDPHQYRQASINSSYGVALVSRSTGPVDQVSTQIARGVKSVVRGLPLGFGQELALNTMKPRTAGPGHRDAIFRWTGNASVGPVKLRLHSGDEKHSAVVEADESLLLVMRARFFRGGVWHKFSNPSPDTERSSVSVAIN